MELIALHKPVVIKSVENNFCDNHKWDNKTIINVNGNLLLPTFNNYSNRVSVELEGLLKEEKYDAMVYIPLSNGKYYDNDVYDSLRHYAYEHKMLFFFVDLNEYNDKSIDLPGMPKNVRIHQVK